jgi:integrase
MAQHLTDKIVRDLQPPERGNRIHYDATVKGFGCRVTAAGARAFVLNYRRKSDGLERRSTIGSYPDWTVAAAREEAKFLKREVDGGGDPVGELRSNREAPTVNDLCDRFEAEQLSRRRASTQIDYKSMLRAHVRPALGKRKVAGLAFDDIDTLHREVTKQSGPYRANRAVALLSKLCSLAIQWQWRPDNPCKGVERNHEVKRKRYLTGEELERLTIALASHDDQDAADIFRLLLLTGARRGEVLSMQWDDLDLQSGIWTKPAGSTKQRTEHRIPLSAPARQLLAGRVRADSPYVFVRRGGGSHRADVTKSWYRICAAARIKGLRIHDLRHSYASHLASAGVGLHVIGALLGHTQPQTTHRYAHLFDDPLRAATERAGALISGNAFAEVVSLRTPRK